jgi:predicted membrane-bound mannosyltransferase
MAVFRRHVAIGEHDSSQPRFTAFPPFVRFIGFYTMFLVAGFSIIPYKTPWCMLGFLHGMILLAGFACAQIVHLVPGALAKVAAALVLLAAAGQLAWQADRATNNFADPRHRNYFAASRYNPYVYAHTNTDIQRTLLPLMDHVAAVSPKGKQILVQVVTPDCWPLPFYLRSYPNVGYWPSPPDNLGDADIVIGTDDIGERLAGANASPRYAAKAFGLRPGVILYVYVKDSLK